MGHSSYGIDDQIGSRIAGCNGGFSNYLLHCERPAGKTLYLCLSRLVAPEVVPRGNGVKAKRIIAGKCSLQNYRYKMSYSNHHVVRQGLLMGYR